MNGTGANVLIKFTGDTKDVNSKMNGLNKTMGSVTKGFVAGTLITKGLSTAFNMVASSTGSAVKRLDTMNNFPKVMSNLGISAKESEEAIKTMSDKLTGLPTSIDSAAASVQRFTSKNGDIKKSTDMFLAMNNAILAGGAPADQQATAIEQLSQAYSKGKPDMMEWKSLQAVMPAQLKQVATQMGYAGGNADKLGEDLRSGKVSMDSFMSAIMDLNKNGGKGFKSFEEQARNSTGGIQTAIQNMKTAITRGLANAFAALDKALKNAGMGGISDVIANIGKGFESVLKAIVPMIPPVVKALATIFTWLKKNETLVKTVAISVGAFVVAFKTISIVIGIINAVKTALATLKLVMTAVNIVMSANPIGAIILAVTALIAIFVLLWKKCDWFRNFWIAVWEGIKSTFLAVWNGLKNAFNAVINWVKTNWKTILLFLINPFAGAFKYLYEHSTKFRTFVNNFVSAVVGFFKAIPGKLKSIVIAIVNAFKNLPSNLYNIGKTMVLKMAIGIINFASKIYGGVKNIVNKIKSFFKRLPSTMLNIGINIAKGIGRGITNGIGWIKARITEFVGSVKSFIKKLFGIKSPSKWAKVTIGGNIVMGIAKGLATNKTAVKQASSNLSDDIKKQLKGKKTNYTKIGQLLGGEFISGIEESLKSIREVADKFKETLSKVDLWNNDSLTDLSVVKSQITQYASNLNKLKNKLPSGLYSQIMEMDREQGLAYTNELLNMNSSMLNAYIKDWNDIQSQSTKLANEWYESEAQKEVKTLTNKYSKTLQEEFKSINKLMGGLGKKATQGLINGMLGQTKNLKGASKTISNNIVNSLKKALKIKSPSRVMMGLGKYTTEGFINGIESMQKELNSVMASTFSLSPVVTGTASTHFSPEVNVTVQNNMKTDPLGQMVNNIKTFSGGAKNDYNYGMGA